MIKQLFVILALTGGLTVAGPAKVSSEVDLSGTYECNGVGPEGDAYKGVVEIVRKDKTYWVQWTLSPQDVNHGFGIQPHGRAADHARSIGQHDRRLRVCHNPQQHQILEPGSGRLSTPESGDRPQ